MSLIKNTVEMLGRRAEDRVTGFKGVISSVSFDLYGCIQLALTPPAGSDGKLGDGHWFDVNRLKVSGKAAMDAPDFDAKAPEPAKYDQGPAEKPAMSRLP